MTWDPTAADAARPTTVTNGRFRTKVETWRRLAAEHDPRSDVGRAYTQCANDIDLILRDDATIQPRKKR